MLLSEQAKLRLIRALACCLYLCDSSCGRVFIDYLLSGLIYEYCCQRKSNVSTEMVSVLIIKIRIPRLDYSCVNLGYEPHK